MATRNHDASGRAAWRWTIAVEIVIVALIGFVGWLHYIGYFGGPIFFDIPATARPVRGEERVAAVILSGDMGFRVGMGPQIARRLAADGIPVVGVSSLTYFRHERSPAEVDALVGAAARRALAFGRADRLVLIGQSFGADMLHVGLAGMAPALRARVKLVALVVPTDSVIYRASPSELFDWATPDARAIDTARRLTWVPVVCIHGEEEDASLCPALSALALPNVRSVALPGGHPLRRDPDAVHAVLRAAIAGAVIGSGDITES